MTGILPPCAVIHELAVPAHRLPVHCEEKNNLQVEDIVKMLYDRGMSVLEAKEKKYGSKLMRELERICLLKNVDASGWTTLTTWTS